MLELELYGRCYKKNNNIKINKGITVLTGPNGCGKSYACQQIRDYLKENNKKVYFVDVYSEGKTISQQYLEYGDMKSLAKHTVASEGQRVFDTLIDNHASKLGEFVRQLIDNNLKEGYIIIDGADSGVSIDLMMSLRNLFSMVEEDCVDSGIDIYIIITSNSFELCRNYDCIWIPTMEHYKRGDEADAYDLWRHQYEKIYKERNKK